MHRDEIIVVTGLPRSGTTMMMRMLEAGGIPLYFDESRPLKWQEKRRTVTNYNRILRETDRINDLQKGQWDWLLDCKGKAVKILMPKPIPPPALHYRFIWMDRNYKHMARSQDKYLRRVGKEGPPRGEAPKILRDAHKRGVKLLKGYPYAGLIQVKFEDALTKPKAVATRVARFIGEKLDIDSMVGVVVRRPARCLDEMMEEQIYAM